VSTEQIEQDIPPADPAVQAVAAEMLDGRRIGAVRPSSWRPDIRDAIPAALAELSGMREALADASDEQIGGAFFDAMRKRCTITRVAPVQFGQFLRERAYITAAKALEPFDYPEGGSDAVSGHEAHLVHLRAWADNAVSDVAPGVDEQARLLHQMSPLPWPNDGCQTSAAAKDFLGRVMDYKRARLAPLNPQTGMRLLVDVPLNEGAYFVLGSVIEVTEPGRPTGYFTARGTTRYEASDETHENDTQSLHTRALRQYHLVAEPVVNEPSSDSEPEQVIDLTAPVDPGPVPQPTFALVAELNERITSLTGDVSRLNEANERAVGNLATSERFHQEDVRRIGDFLIAKANDRGWCSEYDEAIEYLNRDLHVELPLRRRDVECVVTGYVRLPWSVTVTVTADGEMDDSDIEERARDQVENNYAARSLITDYGDAYSAEVEDDIEVEFESID
jgi:hypothetical protein